MLLIEDVLLIILALVAEALAGIYLSNDGFAFRAEILFEY
jgi:hypothetical protein